MYGTIIFLSISIVFLSLMLVINISIDFSTDSGEILIKIKVFYVKILTIKISLLHLFYSVNKSKKKNPLNTVFTKEQEYLFKQIKLSILDKLYYDTIDLKLLLFTPSPDITANTLGAISALVYVAQMILLENHKDLRLFIDSQPNFVSNTTKFVLSMKVYFTVFDMVFAIIMSFYKRGRYVKENASRKPKHT